MRVLITGANGLLGQYLIQLMMDKTSYTIIATAKGACRLPFEFSGRLSYHSMDITDGVAVAAFMEAHQPDLVVHAAAMTQPDPCEINPIECWNVNVTATRFLLDASQKTRPYFVYVSTDFVFDGEGGPYDETDTPNPVNFYGSSKLAAEKAVQESKLDWCIIRTVLVYGNVLSGTRSNIITRVRESLTAGNQISIVTDQWRTPTYVKDLAIGVLLAIEKKATGIFHISGEEGMSPYDMALATANYYGLDSSLINQVNESSFTQPAKRPLKTGFNIDKAKRELRFQPRPFLEALKEM